MEAVNATGITRTLPSARSGSSGIISAAVGDYGVAGGVKARQVSSRQTLTSRNARRVVSADRQKSSVHLRTNCR